MSKLLILQGLQASGKTTYALEWVDENPKNRVRYNWDAKRLMMGGDKNYWVPERESKDYLKKDRINFLNYWAAQGWDIVVDNLNLNPKDIAFYNEWATAHNYEIEFKLIDTPINECIRRDSLRNHPIGEKVIKDCWRRYRDYIIKQRTLKYSKSFLPKDHSDKPHCIIVDLDGTIAINLEGRPFFGSGCSEGIANDIGIFPTISIIENYTGKVIFLTGRNEEDRKATDDWIKKNTILKEYELVMRPPKDFSKGVDFKTSVAKGIQVKYNIDYILEDSTEVVDAFREMDLFVLQPINSCY